MNNNKHQYSIKLNMHLNAMEKNLTR